MARSRCGQAIQTPVLLGSAGPHSKGADGLMLICQMSFVEVGLTPIHQTKAASRDAL